MYFSLSLSLSFWWSGHVFSGQLSQRLQFLKITLCYIDVLGFFIVIVFVFLFVLSCLVINLVKCIKGHIQIASPLNCFFLFLSELDGQATLKINCGIPEVNLVSKILLTHSIQAIEHLIQELAAPITSPSSRSCTSAEHRTLFRC